jgi:hypothetical protein
MICRVSTYPRGPRWWTNAAILGLVEDLVEADRVPYADHLRILFCVRSINAPGSRPPGSFSRVSGSHHWSTVCDRLRPAATRVDEEMADPHDAGWSAAI